MTTQLRDPGSGQRLPTGATVGEQALRTGVPAAPWRASAATSGVRESTLRVIGFPDPESRVCAGERAGSGTRDLRVRGRSVQTAVRLGPPGGRMTEQPAGPPQRRSEDTQ